MGVDWFPCRLESDCTREEVQSLVRLEAAHFRLGGHSIASQLDPRLRLSDSEAAQIRRAYAERGPLHRLLLLKVGGHRLAAVTQEDLFPVEWRVDAERTIPPWELPVWLAALQGYRDEVACGGHRDFLRRLYAYVQVHSLVEVELSNLLSFAEASAAVAGTWTARPELVAYREELLSGEVVGQPTPPSWPWEGGAADLAVEQAFERVDAAVQGWNAAARRGNRSVRRPRCPPGFEEWVALRLRDDRFGSFLAWAERWARGGYGLYRDCE